MKLRKFLTGNNISNISTLLDTSTSTNQKSKSKYSKHQSLCSQNLNNMRQKLSLSLAKNKDSLILSTEENKSISKNINDESSIHSKANGELKEINDLIKTSNLKVNNLNQQIKDLEEANKKYEKELQDIKTKKHEINGEIENYISQVESYEDLINSYIYEIINVLNQGENSDFKIEDLKINYKEILDCNRDKLIEQICNFFNEIIVGNNEYISKLVHQEVINAFKETESKYNKNISGPQGVNFFFNYLNVYITMSISPKIAKIKTFSLIYKYLVRINYINTKLEVLLNFQQKEYKKTKKELKAKIQENTFQIGTLQNLILNEKNSIKLVKEKKITFEKRSISHVRKRSNNNSGYVHVKTTLSNDNDYLNTNPNYTNYTLTNAIDNSSLEPSGLKPNSIHFRKLYSQFSNTKGRKRKIISLLTDNNLSSNGYLGNKESPIKHRYTATETLNNISSIPTLNNVSELNNITIKVKRPANNIIKDSICLYRKISANDQKFNPLTQMNPSNNYIQGNILINHKDQFLKIYPLNSYNSFNNSNEYKISLKNIHSIIVENYMRNIVEAQKGKLTSNRNDSGITHLEFQKYLNCGYYNFIIVFGRNKEKIEIIFNDLQNFNYWANGLNLYAKNNSKSDFNRYESLNSFHKGNANQSFMLSKHFHSIRDKTIFGENFSDL